ncbi:MAG: ECF transporter S component [Clostridia bacterium]|nr:ECF transporter S component [Clostridia bacterium]
MRTTNKKTETMVLGAVMTALVVVFQLLATFTAIFGPFSTAIGLIPIVIGAAICGVKMGGWLGFVFGVVVLASGGANLFLAFDVVGTFVTVLAKGTACGLAAGLAYKLLAKLNRYVAVVAAALVCPVVNTGVFMLGSVIFFLDSVSEIAAAIGSAGTGIGVFWAMAMGNFLFEVGMNLVLSPVIVRLLDLRKKH